MESPQGKRGRAMNFNLWKLDDHPELVEALFAAHREAATANDNASKLCVQQAWGGSGRFENAIIAGMATIGALHAPLVAARDLWEDHERYKRISGMLTSGERIPGFGNAFHPMGDPAFRPVWDVICEGGHTGRYHTQWRTAFEMIQAYAYGRNHSTNDCIPNAALLTAIVASICEVPIGLEPALFALARIPAWAELCGQTRHPVIGGVR